MVERLSGLDLQRTASDGLGTVANHRATPLMSNLIEPMNKSIIDILSAKYSPAREFRLTGKNSDVFPSEGRLDVDRTGLGKTQLAASRNLPAGGDEHDFLAFRPGADELDEHRGPTTVFDEHDQFVTRSENVVRFVRRYADIH